MSAEMLFPYLRHPHSAIHAQVLTQHTRSQADWLAEKVVELKMHSLALCVPPFHLYRNFLTVLKSLYRIGVQQTIIIPVPYAMCPDDNLPWFHGNSWELIPGELDRIAEYRATGDVATVEELDQYLGWLWQQNPLQKLSCIL